MLEEELAETWQSIIETVTERMSVPNGRPVPAMVTSRPEILIEVTSEDGSM